VEPGVGDEHRRPALALAREGARRRRRRMGRRDRRRPRERADRVALARRPRRARRQRPLPPGAGRARHRGDGGDGVHAARRRDGREPRPAPRLVPGAAPRDGSAALQAAHGDGRGRPLRRRARRRRPAARRRRGAAAGGGGRPAMRATCWLDKRTVQVEEVPDPRILNQRDAIVRVTSTAICGSDLHLYNGYVPTMKHGDVLGHEFMGEVVEVGREVKNLRAGDRVVVPFPIACGACAMCRKALFSLCENSNPNAWMAEKLWGYSPAGIFGYSHMLGGFPGGQAEYARVPFADVGPIKVPAGIADERVLFLSDIFPTAWMGAEQCGIQPGDVVAVWGCGPVGLLAMKSALLLGADRVIGIDRFPYRLRMARDRVGAETIDYEEVDL